MRYWALVTAATSWSVLHTIVYDWSRGTHNRSIGAADADLSAAAKVATYSAIRHREASHRQSRCAGGQAHWLDKRHQDLIQDLGDQLIGSQ